MLFDNTADQSVLSVPSAGGFPIYVQRVTRLKTGKRPNCGYNRFSSKSLNGHLRKSEALGDSSNEEGRGCVRGLSEWRGLRHHQVAVNDTNRRFNWSSSAAELNQITTYPNIKFDSYLASFGTSKSGHLHLMTLMNWLDIKDLKDLKSAMVIDAISKVLTLLSLLSPTWYLIKGL